MIKEIEELFKELERLKYNDGIGDITLEEWKSDKHTPNFTLMGVYYELDPNGTLRYWYPYMKEEGIEISISSVISDLKNIKAQKPRLTVFPEDSKG